MTEQPEAAISFDGNNIKIVAPVRNGRAILTQVDLLNWPAVRKWVERFPDAWRRKSDEDFWSCAIDWHDREAEEPTTATYYIRRDSK